MAKDKPALIAKTTLRLSLRPIWYNLEAMSLVQLWRPATRSESASRNERLEGSLASSLRPTKSFLERSLSLLFSRKLCLNDPTRAANRSECVNLFIAKDETMMMKMMRQRAFLNRGRELKERENEGKVLPLGVAKRRKST